MNTMSDLLFLTGRMLGPYPMAIFALTLSGILLYWVLTAPMVDLAVQSMRFRQSIRVATASMVHWYIASLWGAGLGIFTNGYGQYARHIDTSYWFHVLLGAIMSAIPFLWMVRMGEEHYRICYRIAAWISVAAYLISRIEPSALAALYPFLPIDANSYQYWHNLWWSLRV